MCISLPSPAKVVEYPMDAPSETLDGSVRSPNRCDSPTPADSGGGIYANLLCDDALRDDPGMSSPFRRITDDSPSLWSPTLASTSPVSTVASEVWNGPQGNWLFSEANGAASLGESSASEIVPSKMGAGLSNLGNTCFLNAILQCFTHTVPLVQGLRSCTHSAACADHMEGFCVICALRDQVESSLAASGRTLSPMKLVDNLNYFSSIFRRYQQEDAHEFMQCALDKLERCFLDLKKSNINFEDDNLVEEVFGGRLVSKLQCCSCGRTSDTYEPLIDLSLEIDTVDSLPCALRSFTKVETIDAKFRCDNCKEEVSMEKQLMLDQAPSVAAFHLKRFKTDGIYVEKIDKHVDFPLELDLQPYAVPNQNNVTLKYDLYAVVVHIGFSSTSGHYFCFIRSAPDIWHKLDDSKVTKVSGEFVLSQEAYILFYAQQGTPWFSSIMESQTQCLDPSIMSTSPKSVLDVGDCVYKSNSISISKIEGGKTSESKEFSELQDDCYCPENVHDFLELNATSEAAHECGQSSPGSKQESMNLIGSRDVNAVFDGNSHTENGCLGNNYSCHEVEIRENDVFHHLTPPASPSDAADKFYISRDHVKKENHGSCKRPSNKLIEDSERKAAVKYVSKMPGSRRGAFMEIFSHQNEVVDKKRKQIDSAPYTKSNTLGVRKKSNHNSVRCPVAAGISR